MKRLSILLGKESLVGLSIALLIKGILLSFLSRRGFPFDYLWFVAGIDIFIVWFFWVGIIGLLLSPRIFNSNNRPDGKQITAKYLYFFIMWYLFINVFTVFYTFSQIAPYFKNAP